MTVLTTIWKRFLRLQRRAGVVSACRYIATKAVQGFSSADAGIQHAYPYIDLPPFGCRPQKATIPKRHVNWVIPDFDIGSGGHMTLFRLMRRLEQVGFIHHIYLPRPCGFSDAARARSWIRNHFFPLAADVTIGHETMKPAWASIATRWDTAYIVRAFQSTLRKYYLVQDFEPAFYPSGSTAIFAENTYRFGFYGLTAGSWLSNRLASDYKMAATPFDFGVDHHIYKITARNSAPTLRVLFYARPVTERRGFELGLMALQQLLAHMPQVEVVLVGWDDVDPALTKKFKCLGVVPPHRLAYWLNRCDAALTLSLTNLSLLPLEAMACGCAVVSNRGPNVTWLLNEQNTVLADADTASLCEALMRVLSDHELRSGLVDSALEWVRSRNWDRAYEPVAAVMRQHHRTDTGDDGIA